MLPYIYCQTTLSKSSIKHPGQVTIKMKDMTKMLICSIPLAAPSATRAAAASRGTRRQQQSAMVEGRRLQLCCSLA